MSYWQRRRTGQSDMKDINEYTDLHPEEWPFGEIYEPEETAEDLLKLMAGQVRELAKIILWLRCVNDGLLTDMNNRNLRKMSLNDLTGNFTANKTYCDFVKYNCGGDDPLDLSDYVSSLIHTYNQRQLLKQASR